MAHHELEPLGVGGAVVVGDDGSSPAAAALRWAAADAARRGVELVVLRAWSITRAPRPAHWEPGFVPTEDEFAEAVAEQLGRDVEAVLGPEQPVRLLPVHAPAEAALVQASREAVCVVLARHGDLPERLVRRVEGPLVVVP